jgi:hypothetical protein
VQGPEPMLVSQSVWTAFLDTAADVEEAYADATKDLTRLLRNADVHEGTCQASNRSLLQA